MGILDLELRVGFNKKDGSLHAEYKDEVGEAYLEFACGSEKRETALSNLAHCLYDKLGTTLEVSDVSKIGSLDFRYCALSIEEKFHLVLSSFECLSNV
ncbi:hypothetical protein HN903_01420 [archaeon]|jgi:hypothetical protein|nr:hypothetical protein [archaeon]MBT7128391.1 hypothetical protein [archaeon]